MTNEEAIYRQDVLDLAKKGVLISNGNYESVCKAINEIPPVNPTEPCKDAIDRAEAIRVASGYCHPANVAKELAKLPSVNPMPCENAISRQAVRHILNHEVKMPIKVWKKVFELVDDLPPVTPQPKTGHWIEKDGFDGDTYYDCSECGESWTTIYGTPWDNEMKYCPNCGAKMVEPQEKR